MQTPINVIYRMASSYPFYIGLFEDPAKRCGIQSNRIPFLPAPRCNLAVTVFAKMYPQVRTIVGMAPQGAVVSAYGEVGPWFAWLVMVASGLSIGIVAAGAEVLRGPVQVAAVVANCTFAYYLTQVPFLGALTFSHGLVFFLLPLAVTALSEAILAPGRPAETGQIADPAE